MSYTDLILIGQAITQDRAKNFIKKVERNKC